MAAWSVVCAGDARDSGMNEKLDWAGMCSEWLVTAGLTSSAVLSGT